jgi:hypothetical protein
MKCFEAIDHIHIEGWMTGASAAVDGILDRLEVLYSLLRAMIKNIRL